MEKKDILEDIPDEDLPLLIALYRNYQTESPQVYSLLNTCVAWKKKQLNAHYLTLFGVNGDWLKSGTFVLLLQNGCYAVFIFTLEKECDNLYKALTQTKKIDWRRGTICYAVSAKHTPTAFRVLEQLKPSSYNHRETELWVIEREKALRFEIECPDDVYVGSLNESHVALVNTYWGHREFSAAYLGSFIEMNSSYGVFLKSDGSLVCWMLKNHMGQLGVLQTVPEYTRKGYAMLVTKIMSKEIAEEGQNPSTVIVRGNIASESMFAKLGFHSIDICTYFVTK